jgi:hypothetical protein
VTQAKLKRDRLQDEANAEVPLGLAPLIEAKNVRTGQRFGIFMSFILTPHLQESVQERENLMNQFKDIQERKNNMEAELKPLNEELQRLRRQIQEFDGRRTAVRVCSDFPHWSQRLAAECLFPHPRAS